MHDNLKIGVFGVGHLGKIHLKCLQLLPNTFDIIGFYDTDEMQAKQVSETFGIKAFSNVQDLIAAIDVADIVVPTSFHYDIAKQVLEAGKHLFIEKPVTHSLIEAKELVELTEQQQVKAQVGHVERFNPALLALGDQILSPMFIEGHRLAHFNPRGTDVSVVLDLMIHDLDILLHLVDSPIAQVSASGVAVVSEQVDIANARIEFENGCVANLTASRMSLKQMRKMRLFQPDAYVSLDFLDKKAQIVQITDEAQHNSFGSLPTAKGERWISLKEPDIEPTNAIKMELAAFAQSIQNDTTPTVSIKDGYRALELAHRIIKDIQVRRKNALPLLNHGS
ncbi:MAG: Gfo/Idh/MocA family oxidoreductase [Bacteroidota bacterium]